MPFIQWVDEDQATGEVADCYRAYFERRPERSQVAEIVKCFSLRPDLMQQIVEFSWRLHFSDGHLTERVKELIATYVSGQNRCPYCMHTHAYFLHTHGASDDVVAAVGRGDIDEVPISEAEKALLRFAGLLTHEADKNTAAEVQKLRDVGWSEPAIAETVYVTAMFAFFNRVANGFGLDDPKFFEMFGASDPLSGHLPRVGACHA